TSAPGRAFAELGRERNGIFVEEGEDEDASALGQVLGKRGPQGEGSATDRFFAALAARPGDGPGQTLMSSRWEDGFAGEAAKATAGATERPLAADREPGPDLFTALGRPGDALFG